MARFPTGILMPRGTPYPGLFFYTQQDVLISGIPLSEADKRILQRVLGVTRIIQTSILGTPYPGAFLIPLGGRRIGVHASIPAHERERLEDVFTLTLFESVETALGNSIALIRTHALIHTLASEKLKEQLREAGFTLIEITTPLIDTPGAHAFTHADRLFLSPLIPDALGRLLERETGYRVAKLTLRGEHAIARVALAGKGIILPEGVGTEELFTVMEA